MDLWSGASITWLQTVCLQSSFGREAFEKFVSYGPCQIPTLSIVVKWFLEFDNFVCHGFYYVQIEFEKLGQKVTMNWKWENMFDKYIAYALYEEIIQSQ